MHTHAHSLKTAEIVTKKSFFGACRRYLEAFRAWPWRPPTTSAPSPRIRCRMRSSGGIALMLKRPQVCDPETPCRTRHVTRRSHGTSGLRYLEDDTVNLGWGRGMMTILHFALESDRFQGWNSKLVCIALEQLQLL